MTRHRPAAAAASPAEHGVDTPVGTARVRIYPGQLVQSDDPRATGAGSLVLGHGAGGRSWSADLLALTALAQSGWTVVLVEQPWRVAGRTVAPRPAVLDDAWLAVLAALTGLSQDPGTATGHGPSLPTPLVVGGRSAGARVACRTAPATGAAAVLALAFPLHPPGRPERSRAEELAGVATAGMPLLVVNGVRDAFGTPDQIRDAVGGLRGPGVDGSNGIEVAGVPGGHGFTADPTQVVDAVRGWLSRR